MDINKKRKNALITGASQGLGSVIAKRLASEGCFVVVNCASSIERAKNLVSKIIQQGGEGVAYQCDISNENLIKKMFSDLELQYGGIDILVNNARIDPLSRSVNLSEGEWWDWVMKVNLRGAYLCSLEFCRYAESRRWGRIINVSSARAYYPAEPSMVAYTVSKLGLHALTRSFASRCAPYGITVNTLVPGMIMTENLFNRIDQQAYQTECSKIPLQRAGTCDEIADGVIWALNNGFMTGESININGGQTYAP